MPTAGFKVNPTSGAEFAPARLGALAQMNPSSFAFDLVSPMVQGISAGKALVSGLGEAVKGMVEYNLPESVAKRKAQIAQDEATAKIVPVRADVEAANLNTEKDLIPQTSDLKRLQTGNALAQERYIGTQYANLSGQPTPSFVMGPSGKLEYSPEELKKREQAVTAGRKTKEQAEKDAVELEKARFDLKNAKDMEPAEKAAKLKELEVQAKANDFVLSEYKKLEAAGTTPAPAPTGGTALATANPPAGPLASTPTAAVDPNAPKGGQLRTDFPKENTPVDAPPVQQVPPMFLTRFDPANRKMIQFENPAYKMYEKQLLNSSETEQAGRKKAMEQGMEGALNAPISDVEKFLRGDKSGTPYEAEKVQNALDSVNDLSGRVNGWTTGTGGALGRAIPFVGNAAKDFEADVKKLAGQIASNELVKMKAQGGTFGALSEKELGLLESALGSLQTSQTPENFKKNLNIVKEKLQKYQAAALAHQKTGAGGPPATTADEFLSKYGKK